MQLQVVQKRLGARVRALRLKRGWTQDVFADKSGFHRAQIGAFERGEMNLSLSSLHLLAEALGVRIIDFLRSRLGERRIEDLAIGYIAIAADLESGEQVVIDRGDLVEAVRASVSLPGLIAPHRIDGRTLVDGGVLNPLPFDVARERFGSPVVAVAVHLGVRDRRSRQPSTQQPARQWHTRAHQLLDQRWVARVPAVRAWLKL